MKKCRILSMLLVCLLVLPWAAAPVFAADQVNVKVDDNKLNLDTYPQIINGRTMVPLRSILEALGLQFTFDDKNKVITAENKEYSIILPVGSKTAFVNGKEVALDVPAFIENGRTMVPARFISESAGADVKWDAASKTVIIYSANYSKNINNSNNLSNIQNSTVNLTNNTVDNSVNNSNNTVNNYDYSTHITNNVINNTTVNLMTEDLIQKIIDSLMGTDLVSKKADRTGSTGDNAAKPNYKEITVNLTDAPVIIPLERQPSKIWNDGILEYKEIISSDCKLAFLLPKGTSTGTYDRDGRMLGDHKAMRIVDGYGNMVGGGSSAVEPLEAESGLSVMSLGTHIFSKLKDGEKYYLRIYMMHGDQQSSDDSQDVAFTYKDNPEIHTSLKEVRIPYIKLLDDIDLKRFGMFGEHPDFAFPVRNYDQQTRELSLAWAEFMETATRDFILRAEGYPDVKALRSEQTQPVKGLQCFGITILEPEKLVKGIKYNLVPVNQDPNAKWIVDEGVSYTAQ